MLVSLAAHPHPPKSGLEAVDRGLPLPRGSPLIFAETRWTVSALVIWPLHHPEGVAVNEPPHGAVILAALFFLWPLFF